MATIVTTVNKSLPSILPVPSTLEQINPSGVLKDINRAEEKLLPFCLRDYSEGKDTYSLDHW